MLARPRSGQRNRWPQHPHSRGASAARARTVLLLRRGYERWHRDEPTTARAVVRSSCQHVEGRGPALPDVPRDTHVSDGAPELSGGPAPAEARRLLALFQLRRVPRIQRRAAMPSRPLPKGHGSRAATQTCRRPRLHPRARARPVIELEEAARIATCQAPDRDVPGITCGYPLPCPHHNFRKVVRVLVVVGGPPPPRASRPKRGSKNVGQKPAKKGGRRRPPGKGRL